MIPLIYIASPSYSGSTLLTMLLNGHPSMATIGELKWGAIDLETYRCSCGSLLRECPFWLSVQARVEGQALPFDLRLPPTDFRFPDHPFADRFARARNRGRVFEAVRQAAIAVTPVCRERWPTIAAVNRAVIEAVLDLRGASVFVDGSKDPVRLMHLMATGDYDIRVIHLIRDGRGVVNSTIRNKGALVEEAATEWLRTHEQIERIIGRLGAERALRVRYEDLCEQTVAELRRIFELSRVDPEGGSDGFRMNQHHILGNAMRLSGCSKIQVDDRWRNEMRAAEQVAFRRIAGAMNRRYGYE